MVAADRVAPSLGARAPSRGRPIAMTPDRTHSHARPAVTVVIVTYNSEATLARCLAALAQQTFTAFKLLLIDNASTESPRALAAGLPFPVTLKEMGTNLGFAGAMAYAVRFADTELVAALNPDAFPAPDWLARLVAAAEAHPEVAAFGSVQISARDETRLDGFGDHYLVTGQAWRGETRPQVDGDVAYCFGVCAAAALYRAEAARAVGGFDARFFCLYEDVDLSFRLRLAGQQCAVVTNAVVRHIGGASFEGRSALLQRYIGRNQWLVLFKNMPLALWPIALPGFFAVELLAALKGHRPGALRGLMQALWETPRFWSTRRAIQRTRKISLAALGHWLTWDPRAFLRKTSAIKPPQL